MKKRLHREWQQLVAAARSLDRQTVFVLTTAMVFVILQYTLGNRRFFRAELASYFADEWRGLLAWGWWFGMQGVTGFVVPVLALLLLFRRRPAAPPRSAWDSATGNLPASWRCSTCRWSPSPPGCSRTALPFRPSIRIINPPPTTGLSS